MRPSRIFNLSAMAAALLILAARVAGTHLPVARALAACLEAGCTEAKGSQAALFPRLTMLRKCDAQWRVRDLFNPAYMVASIWPALLPSIVLRSYLWLVEHGPTL
jgi:hypothetical protein